MLDFRKRSIIGALRKVLLRLHYRLSLRHIEFDRQTSRATLFGQTPLLRLKLWKRYHDRIPIVQPAGAV
jgi:hypothetical protein